MATTEKEVTQIVKIHTCDICGSEIKKPYICHICKRDMCGDCTRFVSSMLFLDYENANTSFISSMAFGVDDDICPKHFCPDCNLIVSKYTQKMDENMDEQDAIITGWYKERDEARAAAEKKYRGEKE